MKLSGVWKRVDYERLRKLPSRMTASHLITGLLNERLMNKDKKLFRQLWKTYFKSITIKERLNPRKHKQDMPVRYWKYLTEK